MTDTDLSRQVDELRGQVAALRAARRSRFRGRLRLWPTVLLSGLLLVVGSMGGASALKGRNTVFSDDITNGNVRRADLAADAVNGVKVADNSLTGANIDEGTLSVAGMGCQKGAVKGYAVVTGDPDTPLTPTADPAFITDSYNCAGGAPTIHRDGLSGTPGCDTGDWWEVRFPASTAQVVVLAPQGLNGTQFTVTVAESPAPGVFRINSWNHLSGQHGCVPISIVAY